MGQFIDKDHGGATRESRIQIEFLKDRSSIFDCCSRQELKAIDQGLGFDSSMSFDHANDDVRSITTLLMRRFQHGVGFPYAGIGAKKYFELPLKLTRFLRLHAF